MTLCLLLCERINNNDEKADLVKRLGITIYLLLGSLEILRGLKDSIISSHRLEEYIYITSKDSQGCHYSGDVKKEKRGIG